VRAARNSRERAQWAELQQLILAALDDYIEPEDHSGTDWWSPLWQVVRTCKAHPLLQDLDGFESWSVVRRLVPLDRFLRADSRLDGEEDVAASWATAWDKIRYLPGEKLLDAALREAEANPVMPPRERTPGYSRFLALCAALARGREGQISIGLEKWADQLGVNFKTVSAWRQWAVEDGVLVLTREHSHVSRRAAEYFVVLDRLPLVRSTP